jgi:hypothetical protein
MWSNSELDKSNCEYVVAQLLSAKLITHDSVLMRQLRDEDYVAVKGSLRDLASKSIGKHLKDNHAGCEWTRGSTAELAWILKEYALNPGAEENPDRLDDNPVVARNSWKLQHGVSLVLRLLFVACFVLAAYAVATGDDQGLTEEFVEPALYHLWKHSEKFVEPVLNRLNRRIARHEMREMFAKEFAIYQAKVEEKYAIFQGKVEEEGQKLVTLHEKVFEVNKSLTEANKSLTEVNKSLTEVNKGLTEVNKSLTVLKEDTEELAVNLTFLKEDVQKLAVNQTVLMEGAEKLAAIQEELAVDQTVLQQNLSALSQQVKAVSQFGQFSDWLDFMQIAMRLCPNCSETFLNWVKTLVYTFTYCIVPLEKLMKCIGKRFNWPTGKKYVHFVRVSIIFVLQYVLLIIVVIHASEIWNGVIGFWNSANENWNKMVENWNKMVELYKTANSLWCLFAMGLPVFMFLRNFGLV